MCRTGCCQNVFKCSQVFVDCPVLAEKSFASRPAGGADGLPQRVVAAQPDDVRGQCVLIIRCRHETRLAIHYPLCERLDNLAGQCFGRCSRVQRQVGAGVVNRPPLLQHFLDFLQTAAAKVRARVGADRIRLGPAPQFRRVELQVDDQ